MAKLWAETLNITSNPSGAAAAARSGNVVMIVDLIDMSTTAESALEAGALDVLGASPDQNSEIPVSVNPEKMGYIAGKKAVKNDTEVIVAAEPRLVTADQDDSRLDGIQYVLKGIDKSGGILGKVVSNLGREVCKMADFENKILIVVSASGGAAFDAAYNYGAPEVITGTVARTNKMCGDEPAEAGAQRALELACKYECGISIVAASSNSVEDILAAEYIGKKIMTHGFLDLDDNQ
ncbi:MAG: hypothetical protein ACOCQ1_02100 [Halanaerobiaceae bacterium]